MSDEEELKLRLRVEALEARHRYVMDTLRRLLRHVKLPVHATSKTYNNKEVRTVPVPTRALATAYRMIHQGDSQ